MRELRRIGKRIVFALDDDLFLVVHLMVAGRFKWHDKTPKLSRRLALVAIEFDSGTLVLTEAGTKRRASLYVVRGEGALREFDHRARLSPLMLTSRLTDEQAERLHDATRSTLTEWIARLRGSTGGKFPEKVTAFRPEMAVHGKFRQPCPVCGTPVQRIRYADNETDYCPTCQTGGKLLADRGLSRLLKKDWPKSLDEMDEAIGRARGVETGTSDG